MTTMITMFPIPSTYQAAQATAVSSSVVYDAQALVLHMTRSFGGGESQN